MSTALARISSLAQQQIELEDKLAAAEERVKEIKQSLRQVSEVDLPEAMESVEMEEFKLADGSKVKVGVAYYASISEKNTKKAFAWLRKHGFDGLIKHDVTINFAKGEEEKAKKALFQIQKFGWRHKDKETVHPMTLRGFVREQIEEGRNIPLDVFGVERVRSAKITRAAH